MIIINDKYYTRKYTYGGASIFSSLMNVTAKETAKKMAKEVAKKLAAAAAQELVNKAVEKGKDFITKKPKTNTALSKEAEAIQRHYHRHHHNPP